MSKNEWKQGDILIDEEGEEAKILGICGEAYFIMMENKFGWATHSIYTKEELERMEYKLKEEPSTLKITVDGKMELTSKDDEMAKGKLNIDLGEGDVANITITRKKANK